MERRARPFAAVLRWGFGAAMLLALIASVVSVVEVRRARREVHHLVGTAARSTALVGEMGRQVSRMRTLALQQLLEAERGDRSIDESVRNATLALDAAMREHRPLIQEEERPVWEHAERLIGRIRNATDAALVAISQGNTGKARRLLVGRITPLASDLQRAFDVLARANEEESARLLAAANGRLARTAVLEIVLALTLLGGIAAIWWTARRRAERHRRELDRYLARIEASNRDLDAFAGRIAHDLRNALSPLGLAAATLRRAANRPDVVARVAARLDASVARSRAVIDGLLAFSRAASRVEEEERSSVRAAVQGVLDELAPDVDRVGAEVDVDCRDLEVRCAPGLLHIVAANLIGNAVKFVDGRDVRRVSIAARARNGACELTVADTGPGIPPDDLSRIFEPFYRVPGVAAAGTGIGLATVRRIVEARGGGVGVESVPGNGSVFRCTLPLHVPRQATEPEHRELH